MPTFFDSSDLHLVKAEHGFDSYWVGGFVRTTGNENYIVLAHAAVYGNMTTYRGGILSLDDPQSYVAKYYRAVDEFTNGTVEPFHLTIPGDVFEMKFTGPVDEWFPRIDTVSRVPEAPFDFSLDMKQAGRPPVLNAGLGSWRWVGGTQHQVSVTEGRLTGTFTLNKTVFTIDPDNSVGWYDRQWGPTFVSHFTWFGLYLTKTSSSPSFSPLASREQIYASIWNWKDEINGNKSFATIQGPSGTNTVIPVVGFTPVDTFHSPASNKTYSLQHTVILADGTALHIKPVLRDQEFVLEGFDNPFYSGAVEVSGDDYTGYGFVDILPGGDSF
jgi:hypothetical protein